MYLYSFENTHNISLTSIYVLRSLKYLFLGKKVNILANLLCIAVLAIEYIIDVPAKLLYYVIQYFNSILLLNKYYCEF